MIVTINTSSVGLLARVVLALYVFHDVRGGMHRELTVLQKLPVLVEYSCFEYLVS